MAKKKKVNPRRIPQSKSPSKNYFGRERLSGTDLGPFIHFFKDHPSVKYICDEAGHMMIDSYLEPRVTIHADTYEVDSSLLATYAQLHIYKEQITQFVGKLIKHLGKNTQTWRIVDYHYTRDIFIRNLSTVVTDDKGNHFMKSEGGLISITDWSDEHSAVSTYAMICISKYDPADDMDFIKKFSTMMLPIFITDTYQTSQQIKMRGLEDPCENPRTMKSLANHLELCVNNLKKQELGEVQHSPFEMRVFHILMKYYDIKKMNKYYAVRSYYNKEDEDPPNFERSTKAIHKNRAIIDKDQSMYPLLDFNKKENTFMINYFAKKYPVNVPINLHHYIDHCQYGNTFRLGSDNVINMKPSQLTVEFDIHDDNTGIVWLIDQTNYDLYTAVGQIHLVNVDQWTGVENVTWLDFGFICRDPNVPFSNMSSAFESLFDAKRMDGYTIDVDMLVRYVIAAFVLINDRPKRLMMINEKVKRPRSERKKSMKKIDREEADYLVRRILKPIKEAQPYIEKRKRELGVNYQYTVESWERRGHYRRLPKSDRTVWIEATTCKRHLPLSEKEIHLKM